VVLAERVLRYLLFPRQGHTKPGTTGIHHNPLSVMSRASTRPATTDWTRAIVALSS
jgi:hypothetical protein